MGRSSKKLFQTAGLSTVAVVFCLFGVAHAAEIISLHEAGRANRDADRGGSKPQVQPRRARLNVPPHVVKRVYDVRRAPGSDLAYAGFDADGALNGLAGADVGALPIAPQQPLGSPFPPNLPPPFVDLPPPPFAALPPRPPACPLIIEVGRGLRHAVRSHILSGRPYCR